MGRLTLASIIVLATALNAQLPIRTQLFYADLPSGGSITATAVDSSGNLFALGTYSGRNGFVAKINPDFQVEFIATIPTDMVQANAIALDQFNNVYVTGSTNRIWDVAIQPSVIGCEGYCSSDAFLVKVDGKTGNVAWVTYFGGQFDDSGTGVAVQANGEIYVTGTTFSPDFPVTDGARIPAKPPLTFGSLSEPFGFVARISADGKKWFLAVSRG